MLKTDIEIMQETERLKTKYLRRIKVTVAIFTEVKCPAIFVSWLNNQKEKINCYIKCFHSIDALSLKPICIIIQL